MSSREELSSQFLKAGLSVSPDVLILCAEICDRQKLSEANFVDAWMAFSMTSLSGLVPPTDEKLLIFEKKEFGDPVLTPRNGNDKSQKITKKDVQVVSPTLSKTPKRCFVDDLHGTASASSGAEASPILGSNIKRPKTPRTYSSVVPRSIMTEESSLAETLEDSLEQPFSDPMDFKKSKEDVVVYGEKHSFSPMLYTPPEVKLYQGDLNRKYKLMVDKPSERWNRKQDFFEELAKILLEKNNLPEPSNFEITPVECSTYVGKVKTAAGKITSPHIYVEGLGLSSEIEVGLDISGIKNFSVFPGQLCAFKATSRGEKKLIASEFYTDASGPKPGPPVLKEPFTVMVAAGPFADLNLVDFTLLDDIATHAGFYVPQVLILIGPFMSCQKGTHSPKKINCRISTSHIAQATPERVQRRIKDTLAGIIKEQVTVYYIANHQDLFTFPVYPTPVDSAAGSEHHILHDPCLLDLNGFLLAVTSVDVVAHMSVQEYSNCQGGNRIARLASHIIKQQTFYPIETDPMDCSLDHDRVYSNGRIPVVPHVLIAPSVIKPFIEEVDDCLIINPEKCSPERAHGNNLAMFQVRPKRNDREWKISTHISAKIIRI